jgi:hypothetical protein
MKGLPEPDDLATGQRYASLCDLGLGLLARNAMAIMARGSSELSESEESSAA